MTSSIDPESEYRPLMVGLCGEVSSIFATSSNHINAMDMEQGYSGGDNPVVLKSQFLLSLCEQLMYRTIYGQFPQEPALPTDDHQTQ